MNFKKLIYDTFTLQHKISLEKESIDFISQNIKPKDLDILVKSYKSSFGSKMIPFDDFKSFVLSNKKIANYFIIQDSFKSGYCEKYRMLKSHCTSIKLINKLKDKEKCVVFGMYHANTSMLEDESGKIGVELPVEGDYFVSDKMFISVYGFLDVFTFKAIDIKYPVIEKPSNLCKKIAKRDVYVLFFNGQIDSKLLKMILDGYDDKPEMVVITGPFKNFEWYFEDIRKISYCDFVFLPDRTDYYGSKLPVYLLNSDDDRNVHYASNPCEILFNNRLIVILKDEYFYDLKRNGIFGGSNRKQKMVEAIVSQRSYHIGEMDCYMDTQPDLFLINESKININENVNGVNVVTLNEYGKGREFMMYDSADNKVEICQLPDN